MHAEPAMTNDPIQSKLLHKLDKLREDFQKESYPCHQKRKAILLELKDGLLRHQDEICEAISQDFGHRSHHETRLLELMTAINSIKHTVKHLKSWVKPQKRPVHLLFQPAKNKIMYQPLGVVGIIVPWNYPLLLSVGPLISAIAAGNKVMMKLSEYTPNFNAVLKRIIHDTIGEHYVRVIQGEADVGVAFSTLPFDHLLFTGATSVGRHVMRAASENLTPVTLELGGKSPTIIAPDANLKEAVPRILFGKCANAGQTCVAPDYILCPANKIDHLVKEIQANFQRFYPTVEDNPDYTSIINDRQRKRLFDCLDEASQTDAIIISCLEDDYSAYREKQKLPLQLIVNAGESLKLMKDEIFGPILPIVPYESTKQALQYVATRPKPLALYLFSNDNSTIQRWMENSHSGGVTINDTMMHVGQEDLPFGGIGASGMGHYHGHEGFLTFSKAKPIHQKGKINSGQFVYPPYRRSLLSLVLKAFMR
ncbi:coniferyl aldehyde dehydrogenase [Algicola sagamiensis]|uniref:coniferyl aldehyde dehydrogenase n=1 Tax=Algicola sagamiensis TaxID=163869 RepID=UPI0003669184|nr:coniferyl aldehyde dehydrogenase [Algicola sagamiensis]